MNHSLQIYGHYSLADFGHSLFTANFIARDWEVILKLRYIGYVFTVV